MSVILITGAASGLGAAFTDHYSSNLDTTILALDIQEYAYQNRPNVHAYVVNVSSQESMADFVENGLSHITHIDLLIHCAGERGLVKTVEERFPNHVAKCETLGVMDSSTMARTFEVNTIGTFTLLKSLLPHLRPSNRHEAGLKPAKVVVMSSRMGSISNNQLPNKDAGAAYAYRASKAALNQIVRSFAVDVPDVAFVLCHPGRVETKLVRCKEEGAISAQESVKDMVKVIEQWDIEDSGRFYDRFGEAIPW